MTSGLVNASFSLPKGQAVKMIFFAPCGCEVKLGTGQKVLGGGGGWATTFGNVVDKKHMAHPLPSA